MAYDFKLTQQYQHGDPDQCYGGCPLDPFKRRNEYTPVHSPPVYNSSRAIAIPHVRLTKSAYGLGKETVDAGIPAAPGVDLLR
jgi:hypothetical protein